MNDVSVSIMLFRAYAELNSQEIFIDLTAETEPGDSIKGVVLSKHPSRPVCFQFRDWRAARQSLFDSVMKQLTQEKQDCLTVLDRANTDRNTATARLDHLNELIALYNKKFAPEAENAE